MTHSDFIVLDQEEQLKTVLEQGFLIGARQDEQGSYSLYILNSFYIELHYQEKSLQDIYCFTGKRHIALYDRNSSWIIQNKKLMHS